MTTLLAYRYRNNSADLQAHIKDAVGHFYQNHNELPKSVVVSKSSLASARTAIANLKLDTIQLHASGGCLANEIWLERGKSI